MKKIIFLLIFLCSGALHAQSQSSDHATSDQKAFQNINLLNNIGYGVTEKSLALINNRPQKWLNQQLKDPNFYSDILVEKQNAHLNITNKSLLSLYQQYDVYLNNDQTPDENAPDGVLYETFKKRMNYALYSENRLRETMVWFWFNHFNINATSNNISLVFLNDYENNIRHHALGNFKDLLMATIKHPAMLHYLNNDANRSPDSKINNNPLLRDSKEAKFLLEPNQYGYNENYARELLELHTLGVNANYTQKDIENLSKILTGFTYLNFLEANKTVSLKQLRAIDNIEQLRIFLPQYNIHDNFYVFDKNTHDYSDKVFMGETIKGQGENEIDSVVNLLVNSPYTAHFISRKIGTYFLGKEPPKLLVEQMSQKFLDTKGDIAQTLYILLNNEVFWNSVKNKKRTKDVYNTYVSLYKTYLNGQPIDDYIALYNHLQSMEQGVYTKITPEGYSLLDSDYQSSQLILNQLNFTKFFVYYNQDAINKENPTNIALNMTFYSTLSPKIKDENSLYLYFVSPQWINK